MNVMKKTFLIFSFIKLLMTIWIKDCIVMMDGGFTTRISIVEDKNGDKVVFTGSMNESKRMVANYGAIDVF